MISSEKYYLYQRHTGNFPFYFSFLYINIRSIYIHICIFSGLWKIFFETNGKTCLPVVNCTKLVNFLLHPRWRLVPKPTNQNPDVKHTSKYKSTNSPSYWIRIIECYLVSLILNEGQPPPLSIKKINETPYTTFSTS